ncbi:hypothetical protein ACE3MS_20205 [Paenibacillus dendritiformis]
MEAGKAAEDDEPVKSCANAAIFVIWCAFEWNSCENTLFSSIFV